MGRLVLLYIAYYMHMMLNANKLLLAGKMQERDFYMSYIFSCAELRGMSNPQFHLTHTILSVLSLFVCFLKTFGTRNTSPSKFSAELKCLKKKLVFNWHWGDCFCPNTIQTVPRSFLRELDIFHLLEKYPWWSEWEHIKTLMSEVLRLYNRISFNSQEWL